MTGRRRLLRGSLVLLLCLLGASGVPAAAFDHAEWDLLLHRHVVPLQGGQASQVDYAGMRRDRAVLHGYLERLGTVSRRNFDAMSTSDQLALLINAYNAWTIELILGADPDLESIRDLGSLLRSPWKKTFIPLLGKMRSLDDIEHGLIRGSGRYDEPRIHFAVNCASIGCPALREEAYAGERLDQQLDDATRRFLADRSRNRMAARELELSSLLRWYREDFDRQWRGGKGLEGFLTQFSSALGLDAQQTGKLARGELPLSFLEYDWRLNRVP